VSGAALAFTLRASETDFSLPQPTLQAISPCTNNAWKPSGGKPQSATFLARGSALSDRHPSGRTSRGVPNQDRGEARRSAVVAGLLEERADQVDREDDCRRLRGAKLEQRLQVTLSAEEAASLDAIVESGRALEIDPAMWLPPGSPLQWLVTSSSALVLCLRPHVTSKAPSVVVTFDIILFK